MHLLFWRKSFVFFTACAFVICMATPAVFAQQEEDGTETDDYYGLAGDDYLTWQSGFSMGLKVGSSGLGLAANFKIGDHFFISAGGNYLQFERSFSFMVDEDELNGNVDIQLASAEIKGYLFPFNNFPLYLAGGAAVHLENRFTGMSTLGNGITIGEDVVVAPEDVGELGLSVEYSQVSPYAGLGIGRPVARGNKHFSVMAEAGFYYFGEPSVELLATGMLEATTSQQDIVQQNMEGYKYYPVLSLTFNYRI